MKFPEHLSKRLCVICKRRKAKFSFRGRVKRDRQHNMCKVCYRSIRDSNTARQIALVSSDQVFDLAVSVFFRQTLEQPWRPRLSAP
jgi:hypothetical protein